MDKLQLIWNILGALSVLTPMVVRLVTMFAPAFGASMTAKVLLRISNDFIGAKKKVDAMKAEKASRRPGPPDDGAGMDVDIREMETPSSFPKAPKPLIFPIVAVALLLLTACGADSPSSKIGHAGKDGIDCLAHANTVIDDSARRQVPCVVTRDRVRALLLAPECEGVRVADMFCANDGGSDAGQ